MIKKFLAIVLFFVMSFLLIGCKKDPVEGKVPNAPENVVILEDNVSWDKAKNATGYIVVVNNEEYFVDTTTFSLDGIYMEDGDYEIYVKSINREIESIEQSNTVAYTVDRSTVRNEVYIRLLKLSNESFQPNMTKEDFEYEWDYENYQSTSKSMENLSVSLTAAGMSGTDIDSMKETIDDIDEIDMEQEGSMTLLKTKIDTFRNMDITVDQLTYVLYSYAVYTLSLQIEEELEYLNEDDLEMLMKMKDLLDDEKQVFINGIRSSINFMFELYDGIEVTLLNSFEAMKESEEFNTDEFIILKNEVVAMLTDVIPSAQDFENIYSIFGIISGEYLELEKNDWDSIIKGSAIMSINAMTVQLMFLGSIDVTTVNEFKAIVEKLHNEEVEMKVVSPATSAFELVDYILNYIDEFYETNKELIDALPDVDKDAIKTEAYIISEKVVLKVMEQELSADDYTYYSDYVERFFDNIDDFDTAMSLISEKGKDEFDFFIENQGIIFTLLVPLYGFSSGEEDPISGDDIVEYLNQLFAFNKLTFNDYEKADIETVFTGFKIPMELLLKESLGLSRNFDASVEVDALLPHMVTLMYNVVTLENDFISYLDDQNVVESIIAIHDFTSDEGPTNEQMIEIGEILITKLSAFLTEERESLVTSTITVLMDNIMSRQIILDNQEMTIEDVATLKAEGINSFNSFVEQIDIMAEYDFDNLTTEQEEMVLSFFLMFE